ncbi:MAG: hypothetical protein ACI8PT_004872 [Gammaproteobacteria bacterium]|jgi:hypothetical protein
MKLLMFHALAFSYSGAVKSLPDAPTPPQPANAQSTNTEQDAIVVFVHTEAHDGHDDGKLLTKCAKNVKWLANKRGIKRVVLHSFDHLSQSKAAPDVAQAIIEKLSARLNGNGYDVAVTPFGYSLAWNLSVHGDPIAKVFKSL